VREIYQPPGTTKRDFEGEPTENVKMAPTAFETSEQAPKGGHTQKLDVQAGEETPSPAVYLREHLEVVSQIDTKFPRGS